MSTARRLFLEAIPKTILSRTTGFLADIPLPRFLRAPTYRLFARRYGVALHEVDGELPAFRSLSDFFTRPLVKGARPLADAPLVWPCDGRIVTSGPIANGRIEQVKGQDYALEHLLIDGQLTQRLATGTQATIYLAPGDYHRVHVPFDGQRLRHWEVAGGLFPVNTKAAAAIPELFVRNERVVFELRLADGRAAAVVMVAALNVGNIRVQFPTTGPVRRGDDLGVFNFGSTVIVLVERGRPALPALPQGTVVRMGQAAVAAD